MAKVIQNLPLQLHILWKIDQRATNFPLNTSLSCFCLLWKITSSRCCQNSAGHPTLVTGTWQNWFRTKALRSKIAQEPVDCATCEKWRGLGLPDAGAGRRQAMRNSSHPLFLSQQVHLNNSVSQRAPAGQEVYLTQLWVLGMCEKLAERHSRWQIAARHLWPRVSAHSVWHPSGSAMKQNALTALGALVLSAAAGASGGVCRCAWHGRGEISKMFNIIRNFSPTHCMTLKKKTAEFCSWCWRTTCELLRREISLTFCVVECGVTHTKGSTPIMH